MYIYIYIYIYIYYIYLSSFQKLFLKLIKLLKRREIFVVLNKLCVFSLHLSLSNKLKIGITNIYIILLCWLLMVIEMLGLSLRFTHFGCVFTLITLCDISLRLIILSKIYKFQ